MNKKEESVLRMSKAFVFYMWCEFIWAQGDGRDHWHSRISSCMIGKDRTGWVYYGQLAYATQELSRKHQAPPNGADEETIRENSAIDNAIWGIFNFAS
jgi:hypothetical protein